MPQNAPLLPNKWCKKFYNKLQDIIELRENDAKVSGIMSDSMQNFSLPLLSVQEMFYVRKQRYYVFNANDNKTGQSVITTTQTVTPGKGLMRFVFFC